MAGKCAIFYLLLQCVWNVAATQHNPYSLQTAVDALHRREAQLALKEYENAHRISEPRSEYYEPMPEPSELQRQQELNHLLARYLENDDADSFGEFDDGDIVDEQRKRSMFRERGGIQPAPETPQYQSVFREREVIQPPSNMAAEFLKEIDRERNVEREEKYKETLRQLWDKYQEQEDEIEQDLFADQQQKQQQQKQQVASMGQFVDIYKPRPPYMQSSAANSIENRPEYFGSVVEKRRLILPWMPATRRKRFPVAKRSSPKYTDMMTVDDASISGTDEKVAKDLQAIFNESPVETKMMKRSSSSSDVQVSATGKPQTPASTAQKGDKKGEIAPKKEQMHQHDHNNNHDVDHDGDLDEHDHDNDDDHDHDHEHEHEHDEDEDEDGDFDEDDDDKKKKKKKRASLTKRSNPEILKEDQIIPGDLNDFRRKKSVEWSKYFGLDRKKKSGPANWYNDGTGVAAGNENVGEFTAKHFRNHDQLGTALRSNEFSETKLENMDKKLKTIEDLIIDETIKYTGAHEGITSPKDIQLLKDHVISRLATAYSLEKMRRALDKLKQSVDTERHLHQNEIEDDNDNAVDEKAKRVAIKKEKVQFDNNHHAIESATEKVVPDLPTNSLDAHNENGAMMKKKNSVLSPSMSSSSSAPLRPNAAAAHMHATDYNELKHLKPQAPQFTEYNDLDDDPQYSDVGQIQTMNNVGGLMRTGNAAEASASMCPLLDAMEKRCRGIDILSGDIHQELLPICGIHQMCYLCGTSQTACDLQYLTEADAMCGPSKECQSATRSALMILRGAPGPQLGPNECAKNRCLYRAMKDIGGI